MPLSKINYHSFRAGWENRQLSKPARVLTTATFILCLLLMGACSKLQTIEQLTALKSGKEEMLGERLALFKKAVYWGSYVEAGGLLNPSIRREYVNLMKRRKRSERFVDIEVDKIDFDEDSNEAIVDLYIRYYGKPTYLVSDRVERFTWKYNRLGGGWFAHEFKELEDAGDRNSAPSQKPAARGLLGP
jgi:hypothetical protein